MCHLAGHTHYEPEKAAAMFAMEARILASLAEKQGLGSTFADMYAPLTGALRDSTTGAFQRDEA